MQRAHTWLWATIARRFGQETADQLKAEFERRLQPAVSLLSVHRIARAVAAKQRPTLRQVQQLLTIIADQQREIDRLHAELADLDEREQTYAMLADDWGTIVDALQTVGIGTIEQGDGWKAIYLNLPQRLKPRSLRLTTEQVGRGHDRLVAQPTGSGSAPTGTVLGRDVTSSIQVGIEMQSTLPTCELALRTAVVAGTMPTPAACLGGMSRIDRDHRTTPFLGLVLDFRFETGEWPAMHPPFGQPLFGRPRSLLRALADVFEVF
jgi:hypothetical protein